MPLPERRRRRPETTGESPLIGENYASRLSSVASSDWAEGRSAWARLRHRAASSDIEPVQRVGTELRVATQLG